MSTAILYLGSAVWTCMPAIAVVAIVMRFKVYSSIESQRWVEGDKNITKALYRMLVLFLVFLAAKSLLFSVEGVEITTASKLFFGLGSVVTLTWILSSKAKSVLK